jgi:ribosomal protein S27AE
MITEIQTAFILGLSLMDNPTNGHGGKRNGAGRKAVTPRPPCPRCNSPVYAHSRNRWRCKSTKITRELESLRASAGGVSIRSFGFCDLDCLEHQKGRSEERPFLTCLSANVVPILNRPKGRSPSSVFRPNPTGLANPLGHYSVSHHHPAKLKRD